MLAAVYHGPQDLRIEQVPIPEIGGGEILLKVEAASICGTDLRILHGAHRKFPAGTVRIPGHEVVGTIARIGQDLVGYHVVQRVFIAPNWGCGHCQQCIRGRNNLCADYGAIGITQDGAFAEYLRVPAAAVLQGNVMPVAEDFNPAQAALIEPFACVLHGQDALRIQPGETVLVMGAGPIGLMHIKLARLRGAGRLLVSEPLADRRSLALAMGADRAVDPLTQDLVQWVMQNTQGLGVDVVVVAAPSHAAQEAALHLAAIGGRINFFGGLPKDRPLIQFDANIVHYRELTVTGTTACSTADCRRAAEIVNSGRIDLGDLVSLHFPLRQAQEAFTAAEQGGVLKVVIQP